MATFNTSVFVHRTPEQTFSFVSDFRHAPLWDPRTYASEKVGEGPIGLGTVFMLQGGLLTRSVEEHLPAVLRGHSALPYEIVTFEPPRRVAFRGQNERMAWHDQITLSAENEGTRLDYLAELTLHGALAIAEPVMQVLFERIGTDATENLPAAVEAGVSASGTSGT